MKCTPILLLLGLAGAHGLKLSSPAEDGQDTDVMEAMAFTENMIGGDGGPAIRTQIEDKKHKPKDNHTPTADEFKNSQLSEDQAIAALSEQTLSQNQDLGVAAKEEPESKPQAKAKVETQQQEQPKKEEASKPKVPDQNEQVYSGSELIQSTIDLSSITQDGKDKDPTLIKPAPEQPEQSAGEQKKSTMDLPEPNVDVSKIEQPSQAAPQPKEAPKSSGRVVESKLKLTPPAEDPSDVDENGEPSPSTKVEQPLKPETVALGQQTSNSTEALASGDDDVSLQEIVYKKQDLSKEVKLAEKEKAKQVQQKKQKEVAEKINNSMWGQMDSMMEFSKDQVTRAQGFEDPEPEEPKEEEPKPKLSPEEQEKQQQEKMRLFSEFVAADAEASQPVVKKEEPKERPLHFKYYSNGDEGEVTDQLSDEILGAESHLVNKKKVKMKYDHSDPDWGVKPLQPVDYSKAQLNVEKLMEPLSPVRVEDLQTASAKASPAPSEGSAPAGGKKEEAVVELTTT